MAFQRHGAKAISGDFECDFAKCSEVLDRSLLRSAPEDASCSWSCDRSLVQLRADEEKVMFVMLRVVSIPPSAGGCKIQGRFCVLCRLRSASSKTTIPAQSAAEGRLETVSFMP